VLGDETPVHVLHAKVFTSLSLPWNLIFFHFFFLFLLCLMIMCFHFQIDAPVAPDSLRPLDESNQDSLCPLDESNPEETELLIRRSQKGDSNAVIHRVRMRPLAKSRFSISLCPLECLPLVRPISEVDVSRLQMSLLWVTVTVTVPCMSLSITTLMRCFMFPMTFGPLGVHIGRRPMMSLIQYSKMTLTSLTLLARCSLCGRAIID
jgi:hypothetical protein